MCGIAFEVVSLDGELNCGSLLHDGVLMKGVRMYRL